MKRELIWWITFLVVAVVVIGQLTNFTFQIIDIQLHDTYFVLSSWHGIVIVLAILGLLRALTKLADRLSNRSRRLAIFISIINGVFGLVLGIIIYLYITFLLQIMQWHPEINVSNSVGPIVALGSLLLLVIIVEIKTLKKV